MKKQVFFLVFIFSLSLLQAQPEEKLSPQKLMELYKAQIDSATEERNVSKMASTYGKIVNLCRENSMFENQLPENLYQYGMWSNYAGNHQTVIAALIELLDMPDDPDDKSLYTLKAKANNELGTTYFFLEHWDNALIHYQKARDMAIELQSDIGISTAENNIGNIYQKKEAYQQAIEHYLRSLQLQEEINDKETICNTYHNLATCYMELGDFTKCLKYFDLALTMAREIGDKEIEALTLLGLAHYYALEKHNFTEAIKLISRAEEIAKEAEFIRVLAEVYQIRSVIDEERGDFASALKYFKQYKTLSDEFINEKSMNQLHEYEVRYLTQEKQLEIERQQIEIQKYRNRQFIFIGGIIAALLLISLLAFIARMRSRRNQELAEMNAIKDKFFSIISHDLKNPVLAQHNALQFLAENAEQWDVHTLSNYYGALLKSSDDLVELLKNLLNWSLMQSGRNTYNPTMFNLVAALQLDINIVRNMAVRKNIAFETQLPATALVTADEDMLKTVVRNLLANAVKYTASGGKVSFEIKRCCDEFSDNEKPTYAISISDTGVGISEAQINRLFKLDSAVSQPGTAGEYGTGLGLIVSKEMLEKHGSELFILSELGKGSCFRFELKYNSPL